MDPREIGLCALFCGVEHVSEAVKRNRLEVEAFTSLITYESSPCFEKLRTTLIDVVTSIGEEKTSAMLSISPEALKIITTQKLNNSKNNSTKQATPKKNIHAPKPPSIDYSNTESLKDRIVRLYNAGVRIKCIQGLYDLQSPGLIHSLCNWTRCDAETVEKLKNKRQEILNLRNEGKTDEEIIAQLKIAHQKLKEIAGDFNRTKLFFTKQDIEDAKDLAKILKNRDKAARELGISGVIFRKWIDGKIETLWETENGEEPLKKLALLENYFIMKNVEKAAKSANVDLLRAGRWIKQFEKKMTELNEKLFKRPRRKHTEEGGVENEDGEPEKKQKIEENTPSDCTEDDSES
ncbi:unnamed protein product [Blepharisma stoltei]|uniref:Uncharacterized protein n=1 Tax=Blepharisma stoltei TaxID=1481888 RepID=A0AAU9JBQ4_9CILI|nr:unnamed protein product [Blepharisma stoltei]